MKLNWGTGIAIFYGLFMIAMVSMVVKSTFHKPHLVQENYYAKDLAYEDFRQKRQNTKAFDGQIKIQHLHQQNAIQVDFPKQMQTAKGKLTLFRPSNKFLDKSYPIQIDSSGQVLVPLDKNTPKGLWKAQIDWENQGKQFYHEESIVL